MKAHRQIHSIFFIVAILVFQSLIAINATAQQDYNLSFIEAYPLAGKNLGVYPNPAMRGEIVYLQLRVLANETIDLRLYNQQGRLVSSYSKLIDTEDRIAINTESMPAGIYFVQFRSSGQIKTNKLVIN